MNSALYGALSAWAVIGGYIGVTWWLTGEIQYLGEFLGGVALSMAFGIQYKMRRK